MPARPDILDRRDSMRQPLAASLGLHLGVAALITALGIVNFAKHESWGDPNSMGGGAIGVSTVKAVPMLDRSGPTNRLAHDTESQTPEPLTKPQPKSKAAREDADAIALKSKRVRKKS